MKGEIPLCQATWEAVLSRGWGPGEQVGQGAPQWGLEAWPGDAAKLLTLGRIDLIKGSGAGGGHRPG